MGWWVGDGVLCCESRKQMRLYTTSPPQRQDPGNLNRSKTGKRGNSRTREKVDVKETRLPLEACGTSVGIGPSALALIHRHLGMSLRTEHGAATIHAHTHIRNGWEYEETQKE
jgi:hypothetical protein